MSKTVSVFKKPDEVQTVDRIYGVLGDLNLDYIPSVDECDWAHEPLEYNVMVLPAEMPEKIGRIIVPDEVKDMMGGAVQVGRVIALSPLAFTYANWPEGTQHPKVGDLVYYARYAGGEHPGFDGRLYRTIKDQDLMGRVPTIAERRATRRGFVEQAGPKAEPPQALSDLRPSELSDLRSMTGGDLSGVHIFKSGEPVKEPALADEGQDHG